MEDAFKMLLYVAGSDLYPPKEHKRMGGSKGEAVLGKEKDIASRIFPTAFQWRKKSFEHLL